MISQQNVLSWATFFPLIGLAMILILTAARYFLGMSRRTLDELARGTGLIASFMSFFCTVLAWKWFDPTKSGIQLKQHFTWIKSFNIEYLMGVDGLSISMVLLTGLISFVAFIASMPWWGGEKYSAMAGMVDHGHDDGHHPKHFSVRMVPGYMCMLLLLQTGMMGTFVALDMFLFYVFWEVMLLPMYFLIGIYYNSHAAPLADGTMSNGHTFNLLELAKQGSQGVFARSPAVLGFAFSKIAFIALFIGFAIKIPMFPFHTWLPDAHVEAPTPVSVILAGVLLKMGPYGILRFNYPLLPDATQWAAWTVAVFGVINIIYAAFVCLAQNDLKKLIAYSSVSHMGFTLLGMAAMTPAGISGAVFNMFSHGIISPMLFLIVGVIYDRAHHREIGRFGGLASALPEYSAMTGLAFFASLGLPGMCGFVSEFLVLSGSFPTFMALTAISATAVIITAAYYLWAIHRAFLGKLNPVYKDYPDLNWRERLVLYPLGAIAIVLGFYPQAILGVINPALTHLISGLRPM